MDVVSACPLRVGSVLWQTGRGDHTLTVVAKATYTAGMTMWRSDTGVYVQATQNIDSTYVWVQLQRLDGSVISNTFTRVPDAVFTAGSRAADWTLTTGDIGVTWHNDKHWTHNANKVLTQVGDSGMMSGSVKGKLLAKFDQGYLMIQN